MPILLALSFGLIPSVEKRPKVEVIVERLGRFVGKHIDLGRVERLARSAPPLSYVPLPRASQPGLAEVKMGLAMDEAFSFYYADAIELLKRNGASMVQFSPLWDSSPPEGVDGIYIGGGFPEVYALELERNDSMRSSLKTRIEGGLPTLAECGGLMYLTRSITGFEGDSRSMVGVLEAGTIMERRLTLGYTEAHSVRDSILSKTGESLRGHEYHFSQLEALPADAAFAFEMKRGKGIADGREGWQVHNTLACYSHTHLCSKPRAASRFLDACLKHSRR